MDYRASADAPQPDRSRLIVGLSGQVFGIDRHNGEVEWTQIIPGGGEIFLAIGYGAIVASGDAPTIHCYDYLTGDERWTQTTQKSGRATILLEPDQIVCAKGGYIDCFKPDGEVRWRQPLKGAGLGRIALGFPGNVAQADERGR